MTSNQPQLSTYTPQQQMSKPRVFQTKVFGGNGGDEFFPAQKVDFFPNYRLSKIRMGYGAAIDSIQFVFTDGNQMIELKKIGGNGGEKEEWEVPPYSYVSQIKIWYQDLVQGIQFITNNQASSPVFGNQTGNYEVVNIKGNLLCYGGRCGDCVDQIKFYYYV